MSRPRRELQGGPSSSPPLLALLSGLMFLLWPRDAVADAAREDLDRSRPSVVVVVASGPAESRAALAATLRRSLARSGIDVVVTTAGEMSPADVIAPSPAPAPGTVRIWLNLGAPKAASLYVTEGRHVFTRHLALPGDVDQVALDLLDVVVTSTIDAVLAGKQLGVPREEFRRSLELAQNSAPHAGPSKSEGDRSRVFGAPPAETPGVETNGGHRPALFSLTGLYSFGQVASHQLIHGPGVGLDAERGAWRLGAELAGRFPYDVSSGGATVRLVGAGLRVALTRLFLLGAGVSGTTSLALGGDLTHIGSTASSGSVTPGPGFWALDPVIRPSLALEVRRGKIRLGLTAAVDIDLIAPEYVVAVASSAAGPTPSTRPVWVPWRWRPYVAVIMGFAL